MSKTRRGYPPEFRCQMVELVGAPDPSLAVQVQPPHFGACRIHNRVRSAQ
jgi:hypothetical protein